MSDHREALANSAMAAPALTGITMWVTGKDINFWVGVAGLVFILLQAGYLLWKWRRDIRREARESFRVGLSSDE